GLLRLPWMPWGACRGASSCDAFEDWGRGGDVDSPAGPVAERAPRLRAWQREALEIYDNQPLRRDFLVTATPGSGKTAFALALAARLLGRRAIDRVIVVCPTDHLRSQWADAAAAAGVALDGALSNSVGPVRAGTSGYVATYAQVAAKPALHAARCAAK